MTVDEIRQSLDVNVLGTINVSFHILKSQFTTFSLHTMYRKEV
ncbi:unnamed protein product [Haemonchus placei]|uniref:Uncharacterized protein n=1 Tax=Haemonchus placei TaxID=6290 RepID=A0A3P7X6V7_HAEPC|nr:unnamed protein product [Haemonchus placei]